MTDQPADPLWDCFGSPEVTKAFSAMARAALEPKAPDTKTKELIALAIAVATRCDGCIAPSTPTRRPGRGRTRDEVRETIGMVIHMGAGPSFVYGARALEAFDQFAATKA